MQYFLTDLTKPVKVEEFDGEITLLEAKFWPDWETPKFTTLFSHERDGEKVAVPIISGKSYTLEDIQHAVNDHLNVDEQVVNVYHNNGRVTWQVKTNTKTTNVQLSAGLIDMFKLGGAKTYDGITTGQPVNKDSIKFTYSNARTLFLECKQIEDTYLNDLPTKTLLVVPVAIDLDGSITANLQHPVTVTYRNNFVKELRFRVHDEHGNELPLKQVLLRFTINDECLRRKAIP